MFTFDPGLFFWSLATFAGVMFVLSKFAFKPLQALLAKREKSIEGAITKAKEIRDSAQALLEEHQAQLDSAKGEVRTIIENGNKMVAMQQKEAEERAKLHADQLVERALGEIERETQKSMDDMKSTLATLSVRIARQVIRENLNDERHTELADQFIERLKKTKNASKKR